MYWIQQWAEELGIESRRHAELALSNKRERNRLAEIASVWSSPTYSDVRYGQQLLAGHSMDLSGTFHCSDGECLRGTVDQLLLRAWHYFDNVVVAGMSPRALEGSGLGDLARPHSVARRTVASQVEVLQYVKSIGAESSIAFVPKPMYCNEHIRVHAEEAGIEADVGAMSDGLAGKLALDNQVFNVKRRKGGKVSWAFSSPHLSIIETLSEHFDDAPTKKDLKQFSSQYTANNFVAAHLQTATLAKQAGLPIGDCVSDARDLIAPSGPVPGEVAFNLELPVMQELPVREILAVREHHMAEFIQFRTAIRTAIEERIKALPNDNADKIADSVYDDILEPRLIEMNRQFVTSTDSINKRRAAAGTVGATITTVGLTAFSSVIATGLSVGASALLTAYGEWLNRREAIENSDLTFLWRLDDRVAQLASGRSHRH